MDGDPLSAILVTGPAHGTLSLNAEGAFTYTPAANFNGADTFTYKANDGALDSNTATVNITITPVNDAPVTIVPGTQTINEDAALVFSGTRRITVSDVDAGDQPGAGDPDRGPGHGSPWQVPPG